MDINEVESDAEVLVGSIEAERQEDVVELQPPMAGGDVGIFTDHPLAIEEPSTSSATAAAISTAMSVLLDDCKFIS